MNREDMVREDDQVSLCEQCGRPVLVCIEEAIARIKAEPRQKQQLTRAQAIEQVTRKIMAPYLPLIRMDISHGFEPSTEWFDGFIAFQISA